jgi:alpha-mannosidase II
MPFFSGGGARSGALLPTISKPKGHHHLRTKSSLSSPASSRRRGSHRAAASSPYSRRVLALATAVFVALFLLAFLRLGFPSSRPAARSSHARPRARLTRRPAFRRDSAAAEAAAAAVAARIGREAPVDITTRDLYDRIQFLDVDGGPWKQGWQVTYKGDEWNAEKLKVFVAPHSHNDPGWIRTVEEYYQRQSRHILDTIVESLSKVAAAFSPLQIRCWALVPSLPFLTTISLCAVQDPRRKFIWEEMSYLERWWRDAPRKKQEAFAKLVRDGQLEIVSGGWVMNDEVRAKVKLL